MNYTIFSAAIVIGLLSAVPGQAQLIHYQFDADHESLTTNVPLNEINARAFRNFVKSFGYVPGSIWRKQRQGYSASFYMADSVLYVSHYSGHGRPDGTYIYYTGRNAPPDIRSEMFYLYSGDRIVYVDEYRGGDHLLFEIGLEEGNQFRVVQDKNGEVKTIQMFTMYRGE